MKPCIVISGVNLVEGGTLSVFQDALRALAEIYADSFRVVALVHRRELFDVYGIEFQEYPDVKSSWTRRLYFEFVECKKLSRKLSPTLWLAMHDITPDVEASVRAVYCHNPSPFYRMSVREATLIPKLTLFRFFYGALYSIYMRRNDFVVVQQEWLRNKFEQRYHPKKIIVAHPSIPPLETSGTPKRDRVNPIYTFFYPALSRPFKNFELILSSARLLEESFRGRFEIILTINGQEDRYSSHLRKAFEEVRSIRWLGRQTRSAVETLYLTSDCLLFPSKLETWGMPISEWKRTGKPMLVADLPYAYETVGDYENVDFIDTLDAERLSTKMAELITGSRSLGKAEAKAIAAPFAANWKELFEILLGTNNQQTANMVESLGNTFKMTRKRL